MASREVVKISSDVNVRDGFKAINDEFAKNQAVIDGLKKELELFKALNLKLEKSNNKLDTFIADTDYEINTIQLDLKLTKELKRYKEFIYDINSNIETINIYNNSSKRIMYYNISFIYDINSNIETITVKRISDSYKYSKTFTYDIDNNIESIYIVKI